MNAVAFNEESSIVFSGSMDGTMQAWDNRSRSEKAVQVNSFGVSIFILTKQSDEIYSSNFYFVYHKE